jgi:phenylalanyl-tRNA synthetase beta chain
MPVIGIPLDALRKRLGADLPGERLLRVLEEIGCDVEGFARLSRTRCVRCGWIEERTSTEDPPARCDRCDVDHRAEPASIEELPDLEVVRMELLAVRPDMFDPGGLGRALRGYLGIEAGLPVYAVGPPAATVRVDPSVRDLKSLRPHIACAVIEDVVLDADAVKVLMKLQENLHWALGRNRKLASIGVYDFDTVGSEFEYTTEDPDRYGFVPLGAQDERKVTLREILMRHSKGRAYRHLLEGSVRYPILRDRAGQVLAMPPIINSEETKVHTGSRRLFIDVTGMGARIAGRTLNIIVTSLLENLPGAGVRGVTIEGATDPAAESVALASPILTPDLSPQTARIRVSAASRLIGVPIAPDEAIALLGRMRHGVHAVDGDVLEVRVPAYRNDILHERDLIEDLAIAYGYHRIPPVLLPARTVGRPLPIENLTGSVREALCGLGFHEVMTLVLTNDEEHDAALGIESGPVAVRIANPISGEQTRLRSSLLPGLLKIFQHNRHQPLPQRIFEVGDVTEFDSGAETLTIERRTLAFGLIGPKVGFTDARGIGDAVVREFGLEAVWEATRRAPFLEGRCAEIRAADGRSLGLLGEIDPEVLVRFGLENPAVMAELSIEGLAGTEPRRAFRLEP